MIHLTLTLSIQSYPNYSLGPRLHCERRNGTVRLPPASAADLRRRSLRVHREDRGRQGLGELHFPRGGAALPLMLRGRAETSQGAERNRRANDSEELKYEP